LSLSASLRMIAQTPALVDRPQHLGRILRWGLPRITEKIPFFRVLGLLAEKMSKRDGRNKRIKRDARNKRNAMDNP
jgi:hypothetical protein